MIAVIKGDIIASRHLKDQEKWLSPLEQLLESWGFKVLGPTSMRK